MATAVPLPAAFLKAPISHRGYHDLRAGRVENSLSAFRAACEAGYGIELDIQLSRDGVAVVFHDETLDRVTAEKGPVNQRTAAELGRIRLADTEDTIPTLAQVLELVAGRVALLIELKDQSLTLSETDGALERATARVLQGYHGPVAVMSFNPHTVVNMGRYAPGIARGIVTCSYGPEDIAAIGQATCDRLREIPDYAATGSSFISHEAADLARPRVAELKAQGATILCWTIRSPQAEAQARQIARNITFESYPAAFQA